MVCIETRTGAAVDRLTVSKPIQNRHVAGQNGELWIAKMIRLQITALATVLREWGLCGYGLRQSTE